MRLLSRPHARTFVLISALALGASACGDLAEEAAKAAEEACPTIEGDKHVAVDTLADGRRVMLHIAGRECPVVGENTFVLYPIMETAETMHEGMHAPVPAAMARNPEALVVLDVAASMPSMGHGTAKAPTIDDEQPSAFNVPFQMGGEWLLELEFRYAMETTVQTASFTFDVK